jgi:GNAT superfamily N-acetyltransferase
MPGALRDFTDADLDWCVDLLFGWDPSVPADLYRRVLTGAAARLISNRIAEIDGSRAGIASVFQFDGMAHPMLSVVVAPRQRGTGIGSALFADAWSRVSAGEAVSGLPDHDERSLAVARHWGFEILGHGVESVLVLEGRPPNPVLALGVDQASVRADATIREGWDLDAFLATVGDFPESAVYGNTLSNAGLLRMAPEAVWVLLADEGGILAATALDPRDGGEWYVLFTGSTPRARGRGLARAVKQAAHRLAYDAGARAVRTTNEERNERMRALNDAMGYAKVSGDVRLLRRSGAPLDPTRR